MQKRQKMNWDKNLKVKLCYSKINRKFPRFPSSPFCPILKIENSKVSESVLSLRILTIVVTEVAKTTKNLLRQKLKGQEMLLEGKYKNCKVSVFLILRYT